MMMFCYIIHVFSFKSLQQAKEPPQWLSRLVNDTSPIAQHSTHKRVVMWLWETLSLPCKGKKKNDNKQVLRP
ncbi:hypothetical protein HMPREF2955_05820 [Prevotella sp. HMSC073D09]|nr:hypothetical protein HMPREF2955_05820 [Prevotella sp. HMSC073D09]